MSIGRYVYKLAILQDLKSWKGSAYTFMVMIIYLDFVSPKRIEYACIVSIAKHIHTIIIFWDELYTIYLI